MRIEVFLTPGEVPEFYTKGRRVVLVDVLRTCTGMTLALDSGADRIVPTESVEEAKRLLGLLDRKHTLLAGEKDGTKVAGFDLGNSPGGFRDPVVSGKTIIYTSDSGSPLMARMYDEVEKPLVSFVNVSAVAGYLEAMGGEEVSILCAGHDGRFSVEDAVCAGMLCRILLRGKTDVVPPDPDPTSSVGWQPGSLLDRGGTILSDGARTALLLYQTYRDDLLSLVSGGAKGGLLRQLGMEADLVEACRVDTVALVAVLREGRVVAVRPPWPRS
jgi:2-phosphosulfolactate phosphatase